MVRNVKEFLKRKNVASELFSIFWSTFLFSAFTGFHVLSWQYWLFYLPLGLLTIRRITKKDIG